MNARRIGDQWYVADAALTGPARIAIRYGQPHARGRTIVGGLIPNDTVWRFGANEATTLHTDVDMTLGGLVLRRGDYSLYVQHAKDAWTLIVNRWTGQWGSDRDSTLDVGRVPLSPRTIGAAEDALTIYLVPESPDPVSGFGTLNGILRVRWGSVDLTAPWSVRP